MVKTGEAALPPLKTNLSAVRQVAHVRAIAYENKPIFF